MDPFTGASVTSLFVDINNDLKFNDLDRLGVEKRAIGSFDPGVIVSDPATHSLRRRRRQSHLQRHQRRHVQREWQASLPNRPHLLA
jgi:hypothetical protein